jgi:hypothetical protein
MIDAVRKVVGIVIDHIASLFNYLFSVWGSDRYLPWAWSLTYDKLLMDLYLLTNLSAGSAFVTTGFLLSLHHSRGICFSGQQRFLLGWMMMLIGFHLLLLAVTLFVPIYRFDICVKSAGAGVSVVFILTTARFILDYGKR